MNSKRNTIAPKFLTFFQGAFGVSFVAIVAVWGMHRTGWPEPFVVSATASMPRGIWVLERTNDAPQRGDIVALEPPTGARALGCVRKGQVLLKYVAGSKGDRVCVREGVVRLEGVREPLAHTRVRPEGEPGPRPLEGCFSLGQGEVWVATPHARSCDSRYFGPVSTTLVRARARAWLTWETGGARAPTYPPHPPTGGIP